MQGLDDETRRLLLNLVMNETRNDSDATRPPPRLRYTIAEMLALREQAPTLPPDKIPVLGVARKILRHHPPQQKRPSTPPTQQPPIRQEPRIPSPKLVPVDDAWLKPHPLLGDLTGCLEEPLEPEPRDEPERKSPVEASSPPPGFGPQRSASPPSTATASATVHPLVAQYRNRIARGPDMAQNFVSRLGHKKKGVGVYMQPIPITSAAIERLRAPAPTSVPITEHDIFADSKSHIAHMRPVDGRAMPQESGMLAKWFNDISVDSPAPASTTPTSSLPETNKSRDDQLGYNVMSFFNSVKKQSTAGILDNKPKQAPANRTPEIPTPAQHQHRSTAQASMPFTGSTVFPQPPPPNSQSSRSAPSSIGINRDPLASLRGHPAAPQPPPSLVQPQQAPPDEAARHLFSLFANAERGVQSQARKPEPVQQQRPMYSHMPSPQQSSHPQHLFMQQHPLPVVGRPQQRQAPTGYPHHVRLPQHHLLQQQQHQQPPPPQQQSRMMPPPPQHILPQPRFVQQQHLHHLVTQQQQHQHFASPTPGINGTRPAPGATFVGGPYAVKHPISHVPVAVPVPAVASVASATATATAAPPHSEPSAPAFDLQQWFQKLSNQQAQNLPPTHAHSKQ